MNAHTAKIEITSFTFPPRIEFGIGAVNHLGKWIQDLGSNMPFIVTDEGIVNAQILTTIQESLNSAVRYYDIFDRVQPNPTDHNVHEGIALYDACAYLIRGKICKDAPCPYNTSA